MNSAARSPSLRPLANELPPPSSQPGSRAPGSLGLGCVDELARVERLLAAFNGRAMVHTEGTWRAHLSRMAGH